MSSVVTWSVSSYPSTTIATVSPTRIMSTPASSTTRALGASYAVTITSGVPEPLRATTSGALDGRDAVISLPPPSRAHTAPGGIRRIPRFSRSTPGGCPASAASGAATVGAGGLGLLVAPAVQLPTREVVPSTVEAHLDDVTREL